MNAYIGTILIAFLTAMNCSLLGTFLMLRRQAMMGDALSHAILPGIIIAFLVSNSMAPLVFVIGAIVAGLIATLIISFLKVQVAVPSGAAIGITFTALFSLGIFLISVYTKKVDLDQECVLYGELVSAYFDRWVLYGCVMGPKAVYILGGLLVVNIVFICMFYRVLVLTSFDPDMATSIGIQTKRWHYVFMSLTSITVVVCFRFVGAPLVTGFLIVPPATAYLFNNHLPYLFLHTFFINILIAVYGYSLADFFNTSLPGAMMAVASALFFTIFLFIKTISR